MQNLKVKRLFTDKEIELRKGNFLEEEEFGIIINEDTDAYDLSGTLLFKFRKNVIPYQLLKSGYESFKGSIELTEGRGIASGSSHKRVRKDGSIANTTVGNKVFSGNVGYMDRSAMVRYCRKTAFARNHFEKFNAGIPFVKCVDGLYKELCPEHYAKQMAIQNGTNINYKIEGTSFTTVTVNRNFQTGIHKDSGDYQEGFGNLCVYREGNWAGGYFCLPEFGVAIDMQNCDMLFVDVHRWHGNTGFKNFNEHDLRIAFVMYYREYMYLCKQPKEELEYIKMNQTGYLKL